MQFSRSEQKIEKKFVVKDPLLRIPFSFSLLTSKMKKSEDLVHCLIILLIRFALFLSL